VQKAIPDSVKPNERLTPQAYRELKQIFKRRDDYLKSLYKRESDLLVRVEDLKFQLRQLQKNSDASNSVVADFTRKLWRLMRRPKS